VKIDDIEVGQHYAYSSSERAVATGEAVRVEVLSVDPMPSKGGRGADSRNQRMPQVRFAETGREAHVSAKHLVEPWADYVPKIRSIKDRGKTADRLERRAVAAARKQGLGASVRMDHILSTPRSLVIEVPFGADGARIERLIELLED
jgi:hypothetical protein